MTLLIEKEYRFTDISTLFKAKHYSLEMLEDRGYRLTDSHKKKLKMSADDFYKYFDKKAKMNDISFVDSMKDIIDTPKDTIYIEFIETSEDVGIEIIKGIINKAYDDGVRHIIIITKSKLGNSPKKWIINLSISMRIEVFLFGEMNKNPTNHFLVPKHSLVSSEERAEIQQKTTGYNLPQISVDDPISRWLGFLPGDLVKIDRINLGNPRLVNEILFYRLVIDKPLNSKTTDTSKQSKKNE